MKLYRTNKGQCQRSTTLKFEFEFWAGSYLASGSFVTEWHTANPKAQTKRAPI